MENEGLPTAFENFTYEVMALNIYKHVLLTHEPFLKRFSARPLLSLASYNGNLIFYTRDVFQAYTKSKTKPSRPTYRKQTFVMNYP